MEGERDRSQRRKAENFGRFEFEVDDMPKLEWSANPPIYEYPTPTPSLRADWQAFVGATSYRYRVENKDLAHEKPEWHTTKQNSFEISLPTEGKYDAFVEALNAKGQPLAQSDAKTFEVKRRPLLPHLSGPRTRRRSLNLMLKAT